MLSRGDRLRPVLRRAIRRRALPISDGGNSGTSASEAPKRDRSEVPCAVFICHWHLNDQPALLKRRREDR